MTGSRSNGTKVVCIGGSAGSFPVVVNILSNVSERYGLPLVMCLHRLKQVKEGFTDALTYKSGMPVKEPYDKERIRAGNAYLAPSNYHLLTEVGDPCFSLSTEEMVKYSRPSIDVLFDSAAFSYRENAVGVLLSGANTDGVNGMERIKAKGGRTVVQEPAECQIDTMPQGAVDREVVDQRLRTDELVEFIKGLAR